MPRADRRRTLPDSWPRRWPNGPPSLARSASSLSDGTTVARRPLPASGERYRVARLSFLRPSHHCRHEGLDRRGADLLHHRVRLDAQHLERALDARLAERTEAPDIRTADAYGRCAHAQRLDHVRAAAEAGIDQDRDAPVHRVDDLRQGVDGGAAGILAARAVIGDDDAVEPGIGGEHRVLPGEDALGEDLHFGDVAELLEEVPGH